MRIPFLFIVVAYIMAVLVGAMLGALLVGAI